MKNVYDKINEKRIKNTNNNIDCKGLYDLIFRITNKREYCDKFIFKKIENSPLDKYKMYNKGDKIVIEGTSGVAIAVCFNHYLNKYCNSYVGPITRNINLPVNPPDVSGITEEESVFLYRYFLNYCTFGYSLLYYDYEDYEKLTDFMLLSGVNLYLNIIGHEAVIYNTLKELSYSESEINNYITSPAKLPWQLMGNMAGGGINLSKKWYKKQVDLANKINNKMRSFGAEPMVPGFFGMVPFDFKEKFKNSNPIDQGMWCDSYRQPALLLNDDYMFSKVAEIFYNKTKELFGEINYFSGDPFHEGGNTNGFDLKEYGRAIIDEMKKHNKNALWSLQGWTKTPNRDMLSAINYEDVIVISLSSDKNYNICDNFNGYPFIYSSTCNFGGTRIIAGNLKGMLNEPFDAVKREDITLVGCGMTMEGIELDEILYYAFSYNAVRKDKPRLSEFLKTYVKARYGKYEENLYKAVKILAEDIYILTNDDYSGRESVFCAPPSLDVKSASTSALVFDVYYDKEKLKEVYNLLNSTKDKNECLKFDVTDCLRQINANYGWELLNKFINAFKLSNKEDFNKYSKEFLELIDFQNDLMGNLKSTRLDTFIERARKYGDTKEEKEIFAFDALNMLLLWTTKENPPVLMDYAHREWEGMLKIYKERWEIFIEKLRENIENPKNFKEIDWREFEYKNTVLKARGENYETIGN